MKENHPTNSEPVISEEELMELRSEMMESDLYSDLFSDDVHPAESENTATGNAATDSSQSAASASAPQSARQQPSEISAPRSPETLKETGLTLIQVADLVLKQLYLQGNSLGASLAQQIRLPFPVIEEILAYLKDQRCTEICSGELLGPASYRYNLTEVGRQRAREAFEQCRYVGPAPVPLEDYTKQCRLQAVAGTSCRADELIRAFGEFIIRPGLLEELGPAVCSGKSIFLYGPPGNGKTMIAKGLGNFLNNYGGDIYVPYAITTESSIITVFDPTIHQTTDDDLQPFSQEGIEKPGNARTTGDVAQHWNSGHPDLRWRRVRRPVVMVGGELTLEMLDLRYNKISNFYTAPIHIKANCGVFLVDDFGRQIVSPRDLLNRWILPLEEQIDFMTLATGKKVSVPFEQLILFSTNLNPQDLVDDAFLRRIRHKIAINSPDRDLYTQIFQLCCQQRNIAYNSGIIDFLYATFYNDGKTPRSSDPRDLLEIAQSICRFRNQRVVLTEELVAEAAERFFGDL